MTSCTDIGPAENVVPERRLCFPACGSNPDLLRCERGNSHVTGHGFARREPDTLAALQVTDGERMIVLDLTGTGDGDWQTNERPRELSIDFLRPLRQWRTRFIEEQRPVDSGSRGTARNPKRSGKSGTG
jgi:hypothetical protein